MVVLTLEKCPLALRGDLTKWLQEISVGVYVGQVSARVRDKLWERVCEESRNGRAVMVYSARTEQRYDFRVHNAAWEPIDFDGLKLMLRPSPSRVKALGGKRAGFSDASKRIKSQGRQKPKGEGPIEPKEYVVFDLETTGLDSQADEVFEFGAIRYRDGSEIERFEEIVKTEHPIPASVRALTRVTEKELDRAKPLIDVLEDFMAFVGSSTLVAHNASFDMGFLDRLMGECGYEELDNKLIDTLKLARKKLPSASSHKLQDLAGFFGSDVTAAHRALDDCLLTHDIFVGLLGLP